MKKFFLFFLLIFGQQAMAGDFFEKNIWQNIYHQCPTLSKYQIIGLLLMGSGVVTTMAQNVTNTAPCTFPCQPLDVLQTYGGIALEFIGMITFTGDFIANYIFYRRWYPRRILKMMDEINRLKGEEQKLQIEQILRATKCVEEICNSKRTRKKLKYIYKLFNEQKLEDKNE